MAFNRFRPISHFIAPHSWSNDPCGAVYIPETEEYIFCYQWNPGTTQGGNSAWGMAKSKDLVTWEDCSPALRNGISYDRLGVFSGSIVSRIIEGRRILFLFYTSVSALPIHVSDPSTLIHFRSPDSYHSGQNLISKDANHNLLLSQQILEHLGIDTRATRC